MSRTESLPEMTSTDLHSWKLLIDSFTRIYHNLTFTEYERSTTARNGGNWMPETSYSFVEYLVCWWLYFCYSFPLHANCHKVKLSKGKW